METSGMAALLSSLATIVTSIVGWVGDVADTIVGTPLLLFTTGFLALGGAVGIFRRLLSKS